MDHIFPVRTFAFLRSFTAVSLTLFAQYVLAQDAPLLAEVQNARLARNILCEGTKDGKQVTSSILPPASEKAHSNLHLSGNVGRFGRYVDTQLFAAECVLSGNKVHCLKRDLEVDLSRATVVTRDGKTFGYAMPGSIKLKSIGQLSLDCTMQRSLEKGDIVDIQSSRLDQLSFMRLEFVSDDRVRVLKCEASDSCAQVGKNEGYLFDDFRKESAKLSEILRAEEARVGRKHAAKSIGAGATFGAAAGTVCGVVAMLVGGDADCLGAALESGASVTLAAAATIPVQKALILTDVDRNALERVKALIDQVRVATPGQVIRTESRVLHLLGYVQKFM